MSDWSRRDALRTAVTAAIGGLAGCNFPDDGRDSGSAIARQVTDYDLEKVRTGESTWLFTQTEGGTDRTIDGISYQYLTSSRERASLRFADVDATDALRRFLRETDFSTQSVYLFQHPVSACHTLHLVEVSRQAESEFGANFCRDRKPASVSCDPDTTEIAGIAIRLPFPGDAVDSVSGGFGSSCDRPRVSDSSSDTTEDRS